MKLRRVVIVGAGIGGPVLGMWLRRLGLEVVIAEARGAAAPGEGAFLGVAPNGMNALSDLGVAARIAAEGFACEAFRFSNRSGQQIGLIDRSQDQRQLQWPLTMIRRGQLHALLAEEAARRGVSILYNKRLVALDQSQEDKVRASFADGSTLDGDILLGADGLRSTVRALLLPRAPQPAFSGLMDYGGFAPGEGVPTPSGVNEMVFGRRAFFGVFKTPRGEAWWFHNGPAKDPANPQERRSKEETLAQLLALHREDPPWVSEVIRATPEILGAWPIYELPSMKAWSAGRVCLLGDAAHAMSPSAGQGASLAVEDAMVLAQCLRDVREPTRAFQVFEQRRRARVEAIALQARRSGSGKAVSNRAAEWLRDRMLPLFLRLGGEAQSKVYRHRIEWEQPVA